MDHSIKQHIKGYDLHDRIGSGGFGAVYKAYQSTVGRDVAIKVILPGLANQPDFIRRFESEAQLVARLEHPYITPLYDYWRDPEGAYLVMRWLRGGSLRDALQNGPFELPAAALLLGHIAGALSLAHRSGVIHRDIKPGNILLDEDGNAYLTDFGIAKDLNIPTNHTQKDAIIGSLDYISPEQARSEPVTAQTDIYSLGVTLYEMITGHHPFENMPAVERLYKHINDPLPEIILIEPNLQEAVNNVIQKATAKNPDHRYPDALALAADFREAIGMNRTSTTIEELLTQREHEILQMIIDGLANKEIAERLTVTLGTVKWYVNQIYGKLGVRSRVQAIIRARELNLIVKSGEQVVAIPVPTEDFRPKNPYKGLLAFQSADHQDFFGREKIVSRLVERLGENGVSGRFLAVVGPSGSGKSSVVKAGLIPAIWRGDLSGSEKWFVAEMLPGAHPLDELEVALTRIAANQMKNLNEHLQRDGRGLARVAGLILPNDGSELLVVIDQFEEMFTLVEDEAVRAHFLDLLYTAVNDAHSRVRVVITLRADFYDRPLHYPQFGELVRNHLETVMPLSAEELERSISGPAERAGVTFEPGLVAAIISDVNYQPGALPLLQYALTELFELRKGRLLLHEAYQSIGGSVGALAKRAEEAYLSLDDAGRETARQMFLRLVTLGESAEDTRRRTPRSELLALAPNTDVMDEVIDTFTAYRLLSLDNDPGTRAPTVEVAHEAILREWERLRTWLDDSRDEIRLQRQLSNMAVEWFKARQETSFLAHGSRLDQFVQWAAETKLILTPQEHTYLNASIAERQRQAQVEAERQAREQRLERRSQNFLRGLVAVMLLATLGALGLTGVAVNSAYAAEEARVISEANAIESQRLALVNGAQAALGNGDTDNAIALALEAYRIDPLFYQTQITLAQAAYAPGTVRRLEPNGGNLYDVAFSPDGRTAISSSQDDTSFVLWNLETGEEIRRFTGHTNTVDDIAFSPDGRTILSGGGDGSLILWDVASGEAIRRLVGHRDWVNAVAFNSDGSRAVSGSDDNNVIVWDVTTGNIIHRLTGHTDSVTAVAFSLDGRTVLSSARDGFVKQWDAEVGQIIQTYENAGFPLATVAFSSDGREIIAAGDDPDIVIWDAGSGALARRLIGHNSFVTDVALSPDGRSLLSGSWDATMILWDLATGNVIHRFRGHDGVVYSVAFNQNGFQALSGSFDGTARLWDLRAGNITRSFSPSQAIQWILGIQLSPDGKQALTSSVDGTTVLWDIQTGTELQRFDGISSDFSPDGRLITLGTGGWSSSPGKVVVVELANGQEVQRFSRGLSGILSVRFSPTGDTVLVGSSNGLVTLWDVQTGERIRAFPGNTDAVPALAFSPDGSQIIGGGRDGGVVVWDVDTGNVVYRLEGHTDFISSVAFSADGRLIVTSSFDNTVIVWDAESGLRLRQFHDHSAASFGVAFGPDGRTIFSGSADNTIIVWDIESGLVLRQFAGLPTGAYSLRITPDTDIAFVGFVDGTLQQWRLDTIDTLADWTRANRFVPELTCEQRTLYRLEPLCSETTAS